ncbi:MAG TPA: sialate O-acetylesterase [Planctomycetota bacterium]
MLIIKTAWGGKSLNTDFRPPSAGPYVSLKDETPEQKQKRAEATGHYYRLMVDHVRMVLKDIKRVIPDYDEKQGYEVAGFVWLQGWNDAVDGTTYPKLKDGQGNQFARYSEWLADFIRDVRKDLSAPQMPFVIGVMGVGGLNASTNALPFREAMAAPASYPEFKGNVVAVQTAPFWDEPLGLISKKLEQVRSKKAVLAKQAEAGKLTKEAAAQEARKFEDDLISPAEKALWNRGASNAGFHYLGCAKTFALMGKAFAEALLPLQKP